MLRQLVWEQLVFARNDIRTLVVIFLDFQDRLIYSGSFVFPNPFDIRYYVESIDKFWEKLVFCYSKSNCTQL